MVYTSVWVLGIGRGMPLAKSLGGGGRGVTVGWFTQALCLAKVDQEDGLLRFSLLMQNQFSDQSMTFNPLLLIVQVVRVETA